jgi:hypothetical protein
MLFRPWNPIVQNYFATGGVQRRISEGMVNLLISSKLGFKFKMKYEVVSTLLQSPAQGFAVFAVFEKSPLNV